MKYIQKSDGNSGHNDWKIIHFKTKPKDYIEECDLNILEVIVQGLEKIMSSQMRAGKIGAYVADDNRYNYYLFKCTKDPKAAEKDMVISLGGNDFSLKQGHFFVRDCDWIRYILPPSGTLFLSKDTL